MPQHKSAEKRMRTSAKANLRNREAKSFLKTELKKVFLAKNKAEAEKALPEAVSALDVSVKKRIIHKNKAANRKSQMYRLVKTMK